MNTEEQKLKEYNKKYLTDHYISVTLFARREFKKTGKKGVVFIRLDGIFSIERKKYYTSKDDIDKMFSKNTKEQYNKKEEVKNHLKSLLDSYNPETQFVVMRRNSNKITLWNCLKINNAQNFKDYESQYIDSDQDLSSSDEDESLSDKDDYKNQDSIMVLLRNR